MRWHKEIELIFENILLFENLYLKVTSFIVQELYRVRLNTNKKFSTNKFLGFIWLATDGVSLQPELNYLKSDFT